MITVTESATKKIKQQLTRRGGLGIRVGVRTTGCSGLAYVLEYVDELQEGDDAEYHNAYLDFMQQNHQFDDFIERKKEKKKKKQTSLDDFIGDDNEQLGNTDVEGTGD